MPVRSAMQVQPRDGTQDIFLGNHGWKCWRWTLMMCDDGDDGNVCDAGELLRFFETGLCFRDLGNLNLNWNFSCRFFRGRGQRLCPPLFNQFRHRDPISSPLVSFEALLPLLTAPAARGTPATSSASQVCSSFFTLPAVPLGPRSPSSDPRHRAHEGPRCRRRRRRHRRADSGRGGGGGRPAPQRVAPRRDPGAEVRGPTRA